MFCKYCGTQMPNNSVFCPSCGKNAETVISSTKVGFWKKNGIVLGAISMVVVIGIIIALCGRKSGSEQEPKGPDQTPRLVTVEAYTRNAILEVKNAIAPWVRTRPDIVTAIEKKHGTVTVDRIDLKSLYVHTYDNSGIIEDDESNIESIEFVIRFWWDGIFHQDGHTDVQFILVPQGEDYECRKCCVVETDALIDLDDPAFWAGVGAMLFL